MNERIIASLAGAAALLALVGLLIVQWQTQTNYERLSAQMAELRAQIEGDTPPPANDFEARLRALEQAAAPPTFIPLSPDPAVPLEETETFGADAPQAPAEQAGAVDPSLPTDDCIPQGIRFMAVPNETFAVCQSEAEIRLSAIGPGEVVVEGGGRVFEGGSMPVSGCNVSVLSADVEGFAELQVTC